MTLGKSAGLAFCFVSGVLIGCGSGKSGTDGAAGGQAGNGASGSSGTGGAGGISQGGAGAGGPGGSGGAGGVSGRGGTSGTGGRGGAAGASGGGTGGASGSGAGGNSASCPASPPAFYDPGNPNPQVCSDQGAICHYTDRCCDCDTFAGCGNVMFWFCGRSGRPECPVDPPTPRTACTMLNLECVYCTDRGILFQSCDNGQWSTQYALNCV